MTLQIVDESISVIFQCLFSLHTHLCHFFVSFRMGQTSDGVFGKIELPRNLITFVHVKTSLENPDILSINYPKFLVRKKHVLV